MYVSTYNFGATIRALATCGGCLILIAHRAERKLDVDRGRRFGLHGLRATSCDEDDTVVEWQFSMAGKGRGWLYIDRDQALVIHNQRPRFGRGR
jgi:hypothetical protein